MVVIQRMCLGLALRCSLLFIGCFSAWSAQATAINVEILADNNYPPYSYQQDDQAQGIYPDILRHVFAKMEGYQVSLIPMPYKRGLKLLEQQRAFAILPPYYRPVERPYIADYSDPILAETVVVMCRDDVLTKQARQRWPEDYYGLTIGNNLGFRLGGDKFWQAVGADLIKLYETESNLHQLLSLGAKRIDCYMNDRLSILWTYAQLRNNDHLLTRGRLPVLQQGAVIAQEFGHIGFAHDAVNFDYKADFITHFNRALKQVKLSDIIEQVLVKYR